MRASFGPFSFDSDARQVFRGESEIAISPKAFDLLALLIRERPRAVAKVEIHELLWPKTFVSDASLSNLVAELRAAFDDDARQPRWIRTARRFGFAFVGETTAEPEGDRGPRRRLVWESREIPLSIGEVLFGRDDAAQVRIDDASVSRRHARLVVRGASATLEDLGSKNGTFVNGDRIAGPLGLSDGDQVRVGRARLVFRETSPTRSTRTARSTAASAPRRRRRS